MTRNAPLVRLLSWLSPAFPVGSFSYSQGLERAVHDGWIESASALGDWIADLMEHGSAWNETVILAESWRRAGGGDLAQLAGLAEAMAGSSERHLETIQQGAAFLAAASLWPSPVFERLPPRTAYPVAVGAVAGAHGISLEDVVTAYLHAFASNQVQAGIRLGVLGQQAGVAIIAGVEPLILEVSARAGGSSLDDLGSASFAAEIASMKHETQYSRLFRS